MKTMLYLTFIALSHAYGAEYYCSVKFVGDNSKYTLRVLKILGEERNSKGEDVYIIDGVIDDNKYSDVSLHYSIRASSCSETKSVVEEYNKTGKIIEKAKIDGHDSMTKELSKIGASEIKDSEPKKEVSVEKKTADESKTTDIEDKFLKKLEGNNGISIKKGNQ